MVNAVNIKHSNINHYTNMSPTRGTYRPSYNNGLKEDGTPDKRMNTGRETFVPSLALRKGRVPHIMMGQLLANWVHTKTGFAHGRVDPHHAGQAGGQAGGTGNSGELPSSGGKHKPIEHGGLKADGNRDKRVGTHSTFIST